ncbi:hypothetical protein H0H81_000191 [Sphagnurus paluster]|uniref:BRO domain-containing protein 1 n=1 Tax=Sphagnurus paluster TaxID=117069 RepID=A0A9P7K6S2_9AGAR|nr:hypothetical protein H0H81_000191 [Sphagnurus paluster]
MSNQSPMISIPKKTTDDVDWTSPIRNLIAQSYGESPDNYASECAALQRCRQDAVRGAGSDFTARDLLYKYFGQLELLELRFAEIKVTFPWHDAFTQKLTTQTSIAYEKASVLFQIAATHTAIAAAQARTDPEGTKRAFYYFRSAAGMLTYINDNFLHAPSTDLSRDVIKFLSALILVQAIEVFFEKCVDEKKGNALVARIAAQAASMYTALSEEVKEFMGKGIFDKNWVSIIQVRLDSTHPACVLTVSQIKAKYFSSLMQYHRAAHDSASSSHGPALARLTLADTLAKDAQRLASSFPTTQSSATLPPDTSAALVALTKSHAALAASRLAEAQRENDLIYHALIPASDTLPKIEPVGAAVAAPIPIHEVYATPQVQATIGPDIFLKLVPLGVHERASVYSEEKAKLVRAEVERAEMAAAQERSALEGLGVRAGISRFRALLDGDNDGAVPKEVEEWRAEVLAREREAGGVVGALTEIARIRDAVRGELDAVGRELEIESRDCEALRVKWDARWAQEPSAGLSRPFRQELKSHLGALDAARESDAQVGRLWEAVRGEVGLLVGPIAVLEGMFRESWRDDVKRAGSLLDLDVGSEGQEADERTKMAGYVAEIEERFGRLNKIARERNEVLKELKEKIQSDDVSHLLLLNRRNTGAESALFAAELEKFRPYQQRLTGTVQAQEAILAEVRTLWKSLKALPGARRVGEEERGKEEALKRCQAAWERYAEVRDGLGKGRTFYTELTELTSKLRADVRDFVAKRTVEREKLVVQLGTDARAPEKPAKPPAPAASLDAAFASLSMRAPASPQGWQSHTRSASASAGTPPPPPSQYSVPASYGAQYQGSAQPQSQSQYASQPPPPQHQPYQSQPLTPTRQQTYPPQQPASSPPPPPPQQQPQQFAFLPPPPPRPVQSSFSPPPQQQQAVDPYANLGMFNPGATPTAPPLPPPPPPPAQRPSSMYAQQPPAPYGQQSPSGAYGQQQQSPPSAYGQQHQHQPPHTSYTQSLPPPLPPTQQSYSYDQRGYQQPVRQDSYPYQQQYQYGVSSPQQQQQQQQPPPQYQYGQGYGRQFYHVPEDKEHPEMDCYSHLSTWLDYLKASAGRLLTGKDYVFPAIASTGKLKFGEAMSRSGFESLMDGIVDSSGVLCGCHGWFTTHCFRHGGAQYRFMWAPQKLSLKVTKWWGSWSSNENVGTIMRYLLDELMAYEEDFSDILMSHRTTERHNVFMGVSDPSNVVCQCDLQAFKVNMMNRLDILMTCSLALPPLPTQSPVHQPRIPKTTSLDDVLCFWEEGQPKKNLTVPLKLWTTTYGSDEYDQSEAVKLSQIQSLWDEFIIQCCGDFNIFEEKFSGLRGQYTKLLKAVWCARQEWGKTKTCRRCK